MSIPLSTRNFLRSLASGTGHARLHVEHHGLTGFEDVLFEAVAFCHYADPQAWPAQESWLLDLCKVAGVLDAWSTRLSALGAATEADTPPGVCPSRTNGQRAGIGLELSKRGYSDGRALAEAAVASDVQWPNLGVLELIELDGESAIRPALARLAAAGIEWSRWDVDDCSEALDRCEGTGTARAFWDRCICEERSEDRVPFREEIMGWLNAGCEAVSVSPAGRPANAEERLEQLEVAISSILHTENDLEESSLSSNSATLAHRRDADFQLWMAINRPALGERRALKRSGHSESLFFDRLEQGLHTEATTAVGRRLLLAGFRHHFRRPVAELVAPWALYGDEAMAHAVAEVLELCPLDEPVMGARSVGLDILGKQQPGPGPFRAALACLRADAAAGDVLLIETAVQWAGLAAPADPEDGAIAATALFRWAEAAHKRGVNSAPLMELAYPALLSPHERTGALHALLRSYEPSKELLLLAIRDVDPASRALASWGLMQRVGSPSAGSEPRDDAGAQ